MCGYIAEFICYIFINCMHVVMHDIVTKLANISAHLEMQTFICRNIGIIYVSLQSYAYTNL